MFYKRVSLCLFLLLCASSGFAQQVSDTSFQVSIVKKSYPDDDGPVIAIDEAHYNFHTLEGRYEPFAWILKQDGYRLKAHKTRISKKSLEELDILVIANALHKSNAQNWSLPTPSAFTDKEIAALEAWVSHGGRLFLIADHMPFPGAASQLAYRTFGKGKLVVSGEAAMFSAQLANGQFQMGLNHPAARQNIPLLLNLIGWLGE